MQTNEAKVSASSIYAFPRVARGHGSRKGRAHCVQPGCMTSGAKQHLRSQFTALKEWCQEHNLSVPKRVVDQLVN